MQVDVEVGGGPQALVQRDGAAVALFASEPNAIQQVARDDALHHREGALTPIADSATVAAAHKLNARDQVLAIGLPFGNVTAAAFDYVLGEAKVPMINCLRQPDQLVPVAAAWLLRRNGLL